MRLRKNNDHPEGRLTELAAREENTLHVFEVAANSLERIAEEAHEVVVEAGVEVGRFRLVQEDALRRKNAAGSKALKIRELLK